VYTFAKDVRASDMPPLMTPQEWNRELDERVRDTSFDPPVLSRPEVVDGFAGLAAHVARRQGEVADAGKRARVRCERVGERQRDAAVAKLAAERHLYGCLRESCSRFDGLADGSAVSRLQWGCCCCPPRVGSV
jgi:hypothetical protein